jgi:hypothetical protein
VIPYTVVGDTSKGSTQDVIPLTPEKAEILKVGLMESILDIAQHGYTHQDNNPAQSSEFSGLDYETQYEELLKGKSYLEGIFNTPIATFLPPWNTYDTNTLRALEELKFSTISAYKNGDVIETSRLNFIPWTCFLSDLKTAVPAARKISYSQPLIVVIIHAYDFVEDDKSRGFTTVQEFSDLMNWLASQDDVKIESISQATGIIKDLSVQRYIAAQKEPPSNTFVTSTLGEDALARFLYPERSISLNTWLRVIGFYGVIACLGMVLSFLLTFIVLKEKKRFLKTLILASTTLSVLLLIYTLYNLYVYRRGMMIDAGSIGISIGLSICYFYVYKRKVKKSIK